jgi:hypothetical protein
MEAVLRCAELERAARARRCPELSPVRRNRRGRAWRAAVGRRLMRLGARVAGLDAGELAPALRHPRLDSAA